MSEFGDAWRQSKQKMSMSEKVGRILTFMQETACVHVSEREAIAFVDIYGLVCPSDKGFKKFLKDVIRPSLIKLGQSRWYRDTITDLGFALSARTPQTSGEDTKDVLEVDVKRK